MQSYKITSRQIILMIIIFRITTVILFMPSINFPPANQDSWFVVLISYIYTIIFGIPLIFLANRFNNLSFFEYMEKIMGKFIGKFLSLLYGLYFLLNAIFLTSLETKIVSVNILANTPNILIISILIITALYISSKDFQIITWTSEIISPVIIVSIITLIILGLQNVDFELLLPILSDSTFYEINLGAIMLSFITTDIFVLAMSAHFLQNKKDISKIFITGKLYSVLLSVIIVAVTMGALGVEQARHTNYPFLIYTRLISYEAVFERIDAIYTITWLSSNTIKIITFIYFSSNAFKMDLEKKNNKSIIYLLGIIVGLISLYISNTKSVFGYIGLINSILIILSVIFSFVIPVITLIIYFIRRKSIDKEANLQKQ